MVVGPDYSYPDSRFVGDVLLKNRKHFVKYNIARIRELIRYLPTKKLDLFYGIPLLLHINSPEYPGYIDDPQVPHGIYGFYDSGFWTLAKRRLGIEMQQIRSFVSKNFCIKGLYLMGSAGSLGQTARSDFDYWVVFDRDAIDGRQRILLRQKLERIERWAEETYGQSLSFFTLDAMQIKHNTFSGMVEEGLRTGQRSLLKEEFYRTFILIGGQIPYWAVLPVGLKDGEYEAWINTASHAGGNGFLPMDYIDLGNLSAVNPTECYGALFWQFCKAQDDPVKALIKASLMVRHVFFQKERGLLCDKAKERFPATRMDSYFLDPYALAFDSVLALYEKLDDRDGLELIRQCIYLRIIGFPAPAKTVDDSPKNQLLSGYVEQWCWGEKETERLDLFASWGEEEKLGFENRIVGKLWHLYKLVFGSDQGTGCQTGMASEDLAALKNKAASRFKKKKGKLPFASVYLRDRQDGRGLFVINASGPLRGDVWSVMDSSAIGASKNAVPLFSAPELLRVLGWIVFNGFYRCNRFTIDFQHAGSPIVQGRANRLFQEVVSCFSNETDPRDFRFAPQGLQVFVVMDPRRPVRGGHSHAVDYLVRNTWGEMFFYAQRFRHGYNNLLKHHEIAKRIWCYIEGADPNRSCYRIFDLRAVEDPETAGLIDGFIADLRKNRGRDIPVRPIATGKGRDLEQDKGLLLDLF